MTERRIILRNEEACHTAMRAMLNAVETGPHEVEIRPFQELRTLGANSRYWATLGEYLTQIQTLIMSVADQTGHTPMEIRRLIAKELAPEHAALLFVNQAEAAHAVIKMIHGIPTSTRLTKKNFADFTDRMEAAMGEVIGTINAFEAKT